MEHKTIQTAQLSEETFWQESEGSKAMKPDWQSERR